MANKKRRRRYLKKRITELRETGLSWAEIAKKLKICRKTVYNLRETNMKPTTMFPKGNAILSDEAKLQAMQCRRFLSTVLTAFVYGVTPETIRCWQKRFKTDANV